MRVDYIASRLHVASATEGVVMTDLARSVLHYTFCTICAGIFIGLVLLPWMTGFDSAAKFWGW